MVVQLGIRSEIAPAATLGNRTLDVPREPLPRMVEMQHMLAPQAKRREAARHLGLLLLLGLVGARHAHDLEADDAAGEMSSAVGAAYTRVNARRQQRVARFHG